MTIVINISSSTNIYDCMSMDIRETMYSSLTNISTCSLNANRAGGCVLKLIFYVMIDIRHIQCM